MVTAFKQWIDSLRGSEKNILPTMVNEINAIYEKLHDQEQDYFARRICDLRGTLNEPGSSRTHRLECFALVKEAVRRTVGVVMFDEQLMAGWVMADGNIAEMATGEGKTLMSSLPVTWFALYQQGVHVMTVNDYLAKRDYEQLSKVYRYLGLSVGLNLSSMSPSEKKVSYDCDITYGVCNEFGFDYLREQLVWSADQRVQKRPLAYAVMDEIDSLLIDEARTPLIIAQKTKAAPDMYAICAQLVKGMAEGVDYEWDRETNQVMFTELAIQNLETIFMVENLFDLDQVSTYHYLLQSLRAKVLMKRDVHYIVADQQIKLVDYFTGRILEGRQYSDGLHQAIEAKEHVPLSDEQQAHASITIQKFVNQYQQVVGMTGTVQTEKEELYEIYGLEIVVIPTHRPIRRDDDPDILFLTKASKYQAMIEEIQTAWDRGQPVLVGTTSVAQSEEIIEYLAKENLPFQLLNAKTEEEEAAMIAQAGEKGMITVATNMAGRGTDIRLGLGVAEVGGLYVMGMERHESRRIDRQLRGRAGRQGDPGRSKFFLSLEDDLFARFAPIEVQQIQRRWEQEHSPIAQHLIKGFAEKIQKRVEEQMFFIRKVVYALDSVVHEQRETFFQHRRNVVDGKELDSLFIAYMSDYFSGIIDQYCPPTLLSEEWPISEFMEPLALPAEFLAVEDLKRIKNAKQLKDYLFHKWKNQFGAMWNESNRKQIGQSRIRYLQLIDESWRKHLGVIEFVKQGIHHRMYEQRSPFLVFEEEAWKLYAKMIKEIQKQLLVWVNPLGKENGNDE